MKNPTDNGWNPLISYLCLDCKAILDAAGAEDDYSSFVRYQQCECPDICWDESAGESGDELVSRGRAGDCFAEYPKGVALKPPPTHTIAIQTNSAKERCDTEGCEEKVSPSSDTYECDACGAKRWAEEASQGISLDDIEISLIDGGCAKCGKEYNDDTPYCPPCCVAEFGGKLRTE
jgi:hypothetical protein